MEYAIGQISILELIVVYATLQLNWNFRAIPSIQAFIRGKFSRADSICSWSERQISLKTK
jgi:hypothetical protein